MSYGVESIRIHKKLRLDKRAGSDNWYARLTLPNGKRLVKTNCVALDKCLQHINILNCEAYWYNI